MHCEPYVKPYWGEEGVGPEHSLAQMDACIVLVLP